MDLLIMGLLAAACASGLVLFRRKTIPASRHNPPPSPGKLSVIIPARNEERNLPHLLGSLRSQTVQPFEIIVVDDGSEDGTRAIAERYGVKVLAGMPLPPGWTGKNWAVWNGYKQASGDLIAFLDADVRLAPQALASLIAARERAGGVVSVVPYHHAEKPYEKLALIPNILGLFAFTSPFERTNPMKGLYGSCILATRKDYETAQGHEAIKSELLDDLNLGAKFMEAGIPVTNFIGRGMVEFRMYPGGIRSEVEGFGKGAVLSTSRLDLRTTLLVAVWLIGLIAAEAAPFVLAASWSLPLIAGYVLYTAQMYYFVRYTGRFGRWMPALHFLSTAFFLYIMLYSLYRVLFLGRVAWKGRQIEVGGRKR
ncbi:glycosyltransferase [Paenibacillus sacheonensis]|uniref:4,4'-diaponeurosporenoate glycosyltransferase n=1 Tax=Paenibacillus sacheonensis TaxID=742054 RepID=A0A7X4YR68_9BACL|nr:glycosyltransferase [Paenibacillus sacheonensis]MBM7567079.1 glycosyltransferase involved in cell wall biosynthesis [Paenibacillus sacheonensis]NBC70990.1 glycosyltransferase [Paenibacillus sacheonensis]